MSDKSVDYNQLLLILSENLGKVSNALMLKSLIDFRKERESKITEIIGTKAKKAVWELCDGTKNIKEMTNILGLKSHSTVSDHLKVMIDEKIVFRKQIGSETYPISIDSLIVKIIQQNI